jgi:hypothetical protein
VDDLICVPFVSADLETRMLTRVQFALQPATGGLKAIGQTGGEELLP